MNILSGFVLGLAASPTCPSNAHEVRLGIGYGVSLAVLVGLGAVTGDAVVLVAVLAGVLSLLQTSPLLTILLWVLGGLVLLYVAFGSLSEARRGGFLAPQPMPAPEDRSPQNGFRAFWTGFAITAFNPYTALWWVGLLGPAAQVGGALPITFSLAVMLGGLTWFMGLAALLRVARHKLSRSLWRLVLALAGLAVGGYGLYFLWQGGATAYQLLV